MSYKFIPYASLVNDIYIPFHKKPEKHVMQLDSLSLEANQNGLNSVIVFKNDSTVYKPFVDLKKYDFKRKDWFYYDTNSFPHRLTYNTTNWKLEAVYSLPEVDYETESLIINTKFNKDVSSELGVYIEFDSNKYYKGMPFLVSVQNEPLRDITDYGNPNIKPKLNTIDPTINKEFYYDFSQKKIVTNQNLDAYDPINVLVGFYTTIDEVSVKCRLSSNEKSVSNITPIVDYYIAKLSGQDLRG